MPNRVTEVTVIPLTPPRLYKYTLHKITSFNKNAHCRCTVVYLKLYVLPYLKGMGTLMAIYPSAPHTLQILDITTCIHFRNLKLRVLQDSHNPHATKNGSRR